jgi:uncharacterized repeat protein (TIGR01451 family)
MMRSEKRIWVQLIASSIVCLFVFSGINLTVGSAPQLPRVLPTSVADAGPDQTAMVGETVQFDGSGSYDSYVPMIEDPIKFADISGNGEFIVAGWNTSVTFFRTSSNVPLWTYDTCFEVKAAALSENGQYLAIGYANNVAFFDTSSPVPVWTYTTTYPITPAPRESLDISRDGEYIAVGTGNTFTTTGDMYMFNRAGNLMWTDSFPNFVLSVRISGDGNYVVAGSWMHQVRLYSVSTGIRCWASSVGSDPHYATALSYDAAYVASGQGNANAIRLFNRGGSLLRSYALSGSIFQMAMSDDGVYMAEAQYKESVNAFRLLRTDSSTPVWTYPLTLMGRTIDMSLNASYIAAGSEDANVYLFEKASGTPLQIYFTGGFVREVSMDYSGVYYVAASASGLFVFNTAGGNDPLWQWTNARPAPGNELTYVWEFGDGATGTGAMPTHVYGLPGVYTVTLTVTGHAGNSATDSMTVTVLGPEIDLSISSEDIVLSDAEPVSGSPVTLTATVHGDKITWDNSTQETLVFSDNFDSGNMNNWVQSSWNPCGVLEISGAQCTSPPYSLHAQSYPNTNTGPYVLKYLDNAYQNLIVKTNFYLPPKTQAYDKFIILGTGSSTSNSLDSSNYELRVILNDDDYSIDINEVIRVNGIWQIYNTYDHYELTPSIWHQVELLLDDGNYFVSVDGNMICQGSRRSSDPSHHIIMGDIGGSGGAWGDAYWDDVEVSTYSDTSTSIPGQDATSTVSFYLDSTDPANLIDSVENVFVPAGGQTPVTIDWTPIAGEHEIVVVVSDIIPQDSDVTNNQASKSIIVEEPVLAGDADLSISTDGITLSSDPLVSGNPVTITATVQGDQTISSEWVKYGVVLDLGGTGENAHVAAPSVMKQTDGSYVMWYGGVDTWGRIFRATSVDGIEWIKTGMVLDYGGTYDKYGAQHPYVILDENGIYNMWYSGAGYNGGYRYYILRATSVDGITWQKQGLDLTYGGPTEPDGVYAPNVYYDGLQWHMWYSGVKWSSPNSGWINHAHKSSLSDPWIKDGIVLPNTGTYDNIVATAPRVLPTETGYDMIYVGSDNSKYRLLHATSTDGMTWAKDGIVMEPTLPLECSMVSVSSTIIEGNTQKMWYSGGGYINENWRIFYAEKTPGHVAQNAACTVSFYLDSADEANLIGSVENVFVPADGQVPVSIDWTPVAGEHEIVVVVSDVNPPDNDMSNNVASKLVTVLEPMPTTLTVGKVRLTGPEQGFTLIYYEWELLITVTNTGSSAASDVLVKDVLPAELQLLLTNASIGYVTTQGQGTRSSLPINEISPVRSTHIFWTVGYLEPGQSETLYMKVCTRVNPGGNQEFTSPGLYVINEGAYATGIDMISGVQITSEPAPAIEVIIEELEPVVGMPPAPKPVNWNTVKIAKPVNHDW